MANNHLNEYRRRAIVDEIIKDYTFKAPEEFVAEIKELVDKHMTDDEKQMLKTIDEIQKVFRIDIYQFYMSSVSRYLMNHSVTIPKRMSEEGSDFMNDVREVAARANEVAQDKIRLTRLVDNNKTISQFKKNLPQFVEQLNKVLNSKKESTPATLANTSFLDKYKKVE